MTREKLATTAYLHLSAREGAWTYILGLFPVSKTSSSNSGDCEYISKISIMKYVPNKKQHKERCTTVSAWQLSKQKSALAPDHVWTNEDMDPVKIENQTWTWMDVDGILGY